MVGQVVAICISPKRGMRKKPVASAIAIEDHGIKGDAHAGEPARQVSLLALASIKKMRAKDLRPGDFAENITTEGLAMSELKVGDRIGVGESVLLEITQIGKTCHTRCSIYRQAGDCVMPREGVFARVVKGGRIKKGDVINKIKDQKSKIKN